MRRPTRLLIVAVVALVALAGCGDDDETTTADDGADDITTVPGAGDPFDGRSFVTRPGTGGLVEGTTIRISFAEGQIRVEAGCNQMSGGYRVEGDTLVVEALAGTEMGCEPELMEQDARLAELFAQPVPWTLDDWILHLGEGEGSIDVVDEATVEPARDLVGPTWTLETIIDGDSASSVPEGVTATITFADDETYAVEAGCNTGSGTWAEAGTAIYQVTAPALTRRRCAEDAMAVENAVLAVLDGEVAIHVEGRYLSIGETGGGGDDTEGGSSGEGLGFTTS